MKFLFMTLAVLALATCGNGNSQNNNTAANPANTATETTTTAQETKQSEARGTITRGDQTATVSKCFWSNYKKCLEVREDPYRKVYADFNFAAEFESGTYIITTFANEHVLDGGYTWGTVYIRDEGGSSVLKQGKLELTVTDDYCKLKATGIDDDGKEVTVTWEGPMVEDTSAI